MDKPSDAPDGSVKVRRRRGLARMALLLDAAATEFAAVGYDRATTNSIASRAGVSPGSLYQYFDDKAAIASALAERYVEEVLASQAGIPSDDGHELDELPLTEVVAHVVHPLISFNLQHPAFLILFARSDVPELLTSAVQPMEKAFETRIAGVLLRRNPRVAPSRIQVVTETSILLFRGLTIGISQLEPDERDRRVTEINAAICGYLQFSGLR